MPASNHQRSPLNSTYSTSAHHHTRNIRSPHGMGQPTDLLSLIPPQDIHKKVPSKRNHNHLGAPSTTTGFYTNGKKMSKIDTVGRETGGESSDADDSSSTQEDEDADDENDDDDDDEDDEKEPAVESPARMNRKRKYSLTDINNANTTVYKISMANAKVIDVISSTNGSNGNTNSTVHPAGRSFEGRSFSVTSTNTIESTVSEFDDGVITETDDELDYPRKKARPMSACDTPASGITAEDPGSETAIEGLNGDNGDEEDDSSLVTDDLPDEGDLEIEEVEAQELAREFELEGPDFGAHNTGSPQIPAESELSLYDGLLTDEEYLGEPGLPRADDPSQWSTLSGLLYYDALISDDLFSVPVSREDTPATPTPHPSQSRSPVLHPELLHSDEWSDDEEDRVDPELDNPFFDRQDPAVRHVVNSQTWDSAWMDSESEDDVWKYCFSSGGSTSGESKAESRNGNEQIGDEDENYDSDATDLDEDLPLPTPKKDSKLKRLDSPTKPQIICRDPMNRNGPYLGSWVADPDRPICIIEGSRKTMLIPSSTKRFSLDSDEPYQNIYTFGDDGELRPGPFNAAFYSNPGLDSTLSAISRTVEGYSHGDAILNSTEDFLVSPDDFFEDLLKTEYGDANEDSVDEEEEMLSIEDVLALSDSDDDDNLEDHSDANMTSLAKRGGNDSEAEAMLSRWDYISVTAFRKRQQQHKQRLASQGVNKTKGAIKGKLTVSDTTMTPARRRKSKSASIKPPVLPTKKKSKKDEAQWSSTLSPLYEGD